MRRSFCHTLCVLIVLSISGCGVIKQTSIEVLQPAKFNVPDHVQQIVLVDNTESQPPDIGNNTYLIYSVDGETVRQLDSSDSLQVDSLGLSVVYNAANTLMQSGFYDTVIVWEKNMSIESKEWTEQRLEPSQIKEIANATGVDGLYSLDTYIFENSLNLVYDPFTETASSLFAQVDSKALWRFYDLIEDSYIKHHVVTDEYLKNGYIHLSDFGLPTQEEMVGDAAWRVGEKSGLAMMAKWKTVKRVYFKSGSHEFKLGNKYLIEGNLDDFRDIMLSMVEVGRKKLKARAAFNLCFYYEITDQLDEAKNWIDQSVSHYLIFNKQGLLDKEIKMAETYQKVLNQRLEDKLLLEKQLQSDREVE